MRDAKGTGCFVSWRKFDLKQVEKAQNKRQWILLGVVLSLLACLAVAGTTAVVTKHYMLLSAVVLVGGLLPMFFVFEYRRPQAREIVTLAIMTTLCVGVNELCSHTIPLHAGTAFVFDGNVFRPGSWLYGWCFKQTAVQLF